MDNIEKSEAMILLSHVWKCANHSKIFSWERLNRSMHHALTLAIDCGMKFDLDDFNKFTSEFRMHYWCDFDGAYTQSVKSNNLSACHALENTLNRKPFIAKFSTSLGEHIVGRTAYRNESRIAVGTEFRWKNERVTVTSFAKDQSYIIACSYPPYDYKTEGYKERKPNHIFKISHEDLKEANKKLEEK
jgi:hypothetical protein